ncbi:putative FAD-linked oxidoreductase [Usitatibacter rugosus]|uniref:Putative FAD-linked oxidoreductase n=2 Tax=Usitatibacter rugosus TaxID=2732067 RepID=A0A6M4GQX3_9PROT|nr:putative FAD-linked oxidoreductase [Usitatibacter rugosus]
MAPSPKRAAVATALAATLPRTSVLADGEDLKPYECDGLSAYRQTPLVAAIPATEAEVAATLAVARKTSTPVVARGSGTGLSGGALPLADGILLSLAKFDKVVSIDPLARTARVQPGVRNLRISESVAHLGLYYAPDPSSQIACSIGGNVAENSGGVHCLKYGLTVHNILKVRAITIDSEIIELGSEALDAPGYDLLALVTGSEGLLAITLEVTVKLLPKPETAQVVMASFASVEQAGDAVAGVIGAGIVPAGLEMMDRLATRAVEGFVKAGYDLDAAAILLAESDGTHEEVAEETARMIEVMRANGCTRVTCSSSEAERLRYWSGRKAAFPAVGRISPDYYCIDGSIPRKALGHVLNRTNEMSEKYGLRCANVFHAGDGNLHPLILYDANIEGELARTEAFAAELLELCIEVGGTITGEHGVGIEKINQMCTQFRPGELVQFHAVKAAFDPEGLLNPGKMVPTLHRCAEYGAMRVKGGQLPFPDLPRF